MVKWFDTFHDGSEKAHKENIQKTDDEQEINFENNCSSAERT